MRRFNRIYKFFLAGIMLLLCIACQKKNIHAEKRIPIKNQEALGLIKPSSPSPKTEPQFGTKTDPVKDKAFYNFLFKQQKESVAIKDEVANNQINLIKKEALKNSKPKATPPKNFPYKASYEKNVTTKQKPIKKVEKKESFFIQVGAYGKRENANLAKEKIKPYGTVMIENSLKNNKKLLKVQVGPFKSLVHAIEAQKKLASDGFIKTIIIHE